MVDDGVNPGLTKMAEATDDPRLGRGVEITDEHLRHLSPLGWEHIALTGVYRWDLGPASSSQLRLLRS